MDPAVLRELHMRAKAQLRKRMRNLRSAYPVSALAVRNQHIVETITQSAEFQSAKAIALYAPILARNEVDISPLDALSRAQGKLVFYPFMTPSERGFKTGFKLTQTLQELVERGRGFLEPPPEAPIATRGEIDLVLVPALAAGSSGHRLGYGAGFYDATLPDVCPPARCLIPIFDFQLLAELPHEAHDIAAHWVVTDERWLVATQS